MKTIEGWELAIRGELIKPFDIFLYGGIIGSPSGTGNPLILSGTVMRYFVLQSLDMQYGTGLYRRYRGIGCLPSYKITMTQIRDNVKTCTISVSVEANAI